MIKTDHSVINAQKIGYIAKDILENSDSRLMIHSIFEHAVNLVDSSDWMITLLPDNYSWGPQVVILSQRDFAKFKDLGLKAMDIFNFRQLINTKEAQITYRKSIDKSISKDINKIEKNKLYFESLLCQKGNKNGLLGSDNIYSRYAAPKLKEFQILFYQQEFEEAGKKLLELIGLGPGLTPSGDDFVLGIFAAFYSIGLKTHIILKLKDIIIQNAKQKTNIISYNMLRQGAMGGFIKWVEDMANALIYEDSEEIEAAFSKMLQIGSSSGSDISAGILFGLTMYGDTPLKAGIPRCGMSPAL